MVVLAALLSGCLWGGSADDESPLWVEPKSFERLQGVAPAGYWFAERAPRPGLPFDEGVFNCSWDRTTLQRVERSGYALWPEDDGAFTILCWACGTLDAVAFRSFAENVTGADAARLDAWVEEFNAGILRGSGQAPVAVSGPLRLEALYRSLPNHTWSHDAWARPGSFVVAAADWEFTFESTLRSLVEAEEASEFRLSCDPSGTCQYTHHGEINQAPAALLPRLHRAQAAVGFASVTPEGHWSQSHGDWARPAGFPRAAPFQGTASACHAAALNRGPARLSDAFCMRA